ncbi:hypothetical protein [Streptomyces sp. NBC_00525]|uniref:hypothetical protein n=1 Tax=Streptomyces sp. NBC_00525 TaxID=2903660 RepID=UPI002E80844C|nr:hypothetical protein [Streptomyces sp. NBC_00525]WUC95062.1 hypothetical protein OG710_16375 [Streptomyces sp. NBC_00525]
MGEPPKKSREAFRRRTARRPETAQGANGNVVGRDLRQEINIHVGTAAEAKKALGGASRAPSRRAVLLGGAALAATAGTLVAVRLTGTDDGRKPQGPRPLSDLFAFSKRDSAPFIEAGFTKRIDATMQTPDNKNEYWLFSGAQVTRIQVTDGESNFADVVQNPGPLTNWGSLQAAPGEDSPPFEKIDAVMRWPDDRNKYWLFSGSRFLRVHVNDGFYHVDTRVPEDSQPNPQPNPLSYWGSLSDTSPSFAKIDAVANTPDNRNEYWVFSGSHYLRLKVADGSIHDDDVVQNPKPLSNWGGLDRYPSFASGIDAVMQMPNDPKEYVVFSGRQYLRTAWTGSTWSVK